MNETFLIEVGYKEGVTDPVGQALARDIALLGLAKVKSVASAQLYRIEGQFSAAERNRIAEDLLSDPVIQDFRESGVESGGPDRRRVQKDSGMVLDVWFKPGVTDAVGESVLKGIRDLNVRGAKEVRTGMRYHLKGIARRETADKIALSLLVNPLIHERTIHAD